MSRRDARRHIFNLMFQNEFNKKLTLMKALKHTEMNTKTLKEKIFFLLKMNILAF